MMHAEAWHWLETKIRPQLEGARHVLDFGGCDVNGSPRLLFSLNTDYLVLDARRGPDVNIVAEGVTWNPPADLRGTFDVVISTEVFEHVEHWRGILYNLWLAVRPAGTCLITCATHPRAPHSILGIEPPPPGEWYRNIDVEEILAPMHFLFRGVEHVLHQRGDIYIRGVR
jgi:hypothetical protein